LGQFQRNIELYTKKIVKKLLKIWFWDPGSGKNLFRIPDPGVKKAPDPGSATLIGNIGIPVENTCKYGTVWSYGPVQCTLYYVMYPLS
jgi:hypothetical protein